MSNGKEAKTGSLKVYDLHCDFIKDPAGIESPHPLLQWKIHSSRPSMLQSAYEIIVSSSLENLNKNIGDLWQTGKIFTRQSANIPYGGKTLQSRMLCFWKVRIWDENGMSCEFSNPAKWEMGLVDPADWIAKWISRTDKIDSVYPAPLFRKEFRAGSIPEKARVYLTGLGYFELFINGKKVGDHQLDPAVTRYDKRTKYVIFDVKDYLKPGLNTIGIMLGNGWYNQHTRSAWNFDKAPWRAAPVFRLQLELWNKDGVSEKLVSDDQWKTSTGAVLFDGIRNGETYDARLEKRGWTENGFDDRNWAKAKLVNGPSGIMSAQLLPPIRVIDTVRVIRIFEPGPGIWLVDFGKGMAGRVHLKISGRAGQKINIHYGEKLNPDGTLDQKELARFIRTGETQTDHYVLKGMGIEEWSPHFVYHGFQYVEISGFEGKLTAENLFAEEIHTDLETTGTFECSNPLFNRLHLAARQSFLSNFHSYPEDCPHREKIGWTGDAQLTARMGIFNFDMKRAYLKWLDDFTDDQRTTGQLPGIIPTSGWGYSLGREAGKSERGYGPQWEGAFITIIWDLYRSTGNTELVKKYYPFAKKYIDYLTTYSENHLLDFGIDDHKFLKTTTTVPLIASAYYFHLTVLLGEMAAVIGDTADSLQYAELASKIKSSFNARFRNSEKKVYDNGSQTGQSLALNMGLTLPGDDSITLGNLLDSLASDHWHFDAGVLGVKAITGIMIKKDQAENMYRILSQDDYPSFGNWIRMGATTLWQDWQGERSLDHIMFGSFTEYFYQSLAGIQADEKNPGYQHFFLKPSFVKELSYVKASWQSLYGRIESNWDRKDGAIKYHCRIPANTSAALWIPAEWKNYSVSVLNGAPVKFPQKSGGDGTRIVELGSGEYVIRQLEN